MIGNHAVRAITLAFVFIAAIKGYGEIAFVGVISVGPDSLFAIRAEEASPARWMRLGDNAGGFVVSAYEAKSETLTLRKGAESMTLALAKAHVRMTPDETFAGLRKALNLPDAGQFADLYHPKLRPYFDLANRDSLIYRTMLGDEEKIAAGARAEIRELTKQELDMFDARLAALENVLGVRPTHGLWIFVDGHLSSMMFVTNVGDRWYLSPSLPKK
jgi:hypothetical protein